MNKTQLIDTLAARYEGNRKAAQHALESVLDTITREVAKGEKVAITGFGSFEKRVRDARWVRNPRTGERIKAKKTAVPKFTRRCGPEGRRLRREEAAEADARRPPGRPRRPRRPRRGPARRRPAKKAPPRRLRPRRRREEGPPPRRPHRRRSRRPSSRQEGGAGEEGDGKKTTCQEGRPQEGPAKKAPAKKARPRRPPPRRPPRSPDAPSRLRAGRRSAARPQVISAGRPATTTAVCAPTPMPMAARPGRPRRRRRAAAAGGRPATGWAPPSRWRAAERKPNSGTNASCGAV